MKNTEKEEEIYYGEIPAEVLEEMEPQVIRQYFLWDEILKREAELYPRLFLPLIEEIFHKSYPENVKVTLLSTEYVVSREKGEGGKTLHSIYSDLVIQAGKRDIYHFECQMRRDKSMVIRMMEYDLHIALTHGMIEEDRKEGRDFQMYLPHSAILYLEHTKNTPDVEKCHIHFQDGGSSIFSVPVMKVQKYSLKMIEERKLFLLIPFTAIRYRKYIDRETKQIHEEKARKSLTGFVKECIIILNRQVLNGTMTEIEYRDITELLWKAFVQLFNDDEELIREVQGNMKSIIRLTSDDLRDALRENEDMKSIIRLTSDDLRDALRENEELLREKRELLQKNEETVQKHETSIHNIIIQCQKDGKNRDEICAYIQNIFMLKEEEAEEKIKLYWKE